MIVYVVQSGEQGEGGSVNAIFKSKEAAIKFALELKPCFAGGWVKARGFTEERPKWINGCDYIEVEEWAVI